MFVRLAGWMVLLARSPAAKYAELLAPVTDPATARMRHHNVLGGLIHEYERAA
jgi:hypothetical protein